MIDILSSSIESARAVSIVSRDKAFELKASGKNLSQLLLPSFGNAFGGWGDDSKYNERYSLNRNWVYAAINAIAMEAAAQPVVAGRPIKKKKTDKETPKGQKNRVSVAKQKMTTAARQKFANQDFDLLPNHPILDVLEQPNAIQSRFDFVYSFIANLCLTGWGYIVQDIREDGTPEYYSLPTTWIKVDHTDGPFSRFRIVNPERPQTNDGSEKDWLDRSQVAFAHLPNPQNPLTSLAPAGSQIAAIRINDHIETSRERFFRNGVFPSVVVTIGKDPHPEVPGGIRPRLTSEQRRQVNAIIQRNLSGVHNYGNPAIVDGLIESITKLSMTDNEMGWEKSEASVKSNILSAFCVHPYLLGDHQNIGGYAQVANIEKRFFKRVNAYLDMLGSAITAIVNSDKDKKDLVIWWEECKAEDPTRVDAQLRFARQNNDITQNEYRAAIGLPPDEDKADQRLKTSDVSAIASLLSQVSKGELAPDQAEVLLIEMGVEPKTAKKVSKPKNRKEDTKVRNTLLSTVGGMQGATQMLTALGQGAIAGETVSKLFALFFEISDKEAQEIVAATEELTQKAKEEAEAQQQAMMEQQQGQQVPGGEQPEEIPEEQEEQPEFPFTGQEDQMEEVFMNLESAVNALNLTPKEVADKILLKLKFMGVSP